MINKLKKLLDKRIIGSDVKSFVQYEKMIPTFL